MRLSDLFDAEVLDAQGEHVGYVNDVRLVKSGPRLGAFGAALAIDGLVVDGRMPGGHLGYDRSEMHGPWLLQKLMTFLHRKAVYAKWEDVASYGDRKVTLRRRRSELDPVPML